MRKSVWTGLVCIIFGSGLAVVPAGCQLQSGGSSTGFQVVSTRSNDSNVSEPKLLRFASLSRITVPGERPYARDLYKDDIALDIVPNRKIDAVTGRELASLPRFERRRLSALPYARRSVLYNAIIRRHARANGISYELARAVIYSESSFRVNAKGRHGEIGLMQVKPSTARALGFRGSNNQLYLPETNIKYGMKYLRKAKDKGDGTICGTILKYNAGLYSKRMNPISARYCQKVKRLMRQASATATG